MKISFIIIILITSLFFISCDKNTKQENSNIQNITKQEEKTNVSGENLDNDTKRIPYSEYVQRDNPPSEEQSSKTNEENQAKIELPSTNIPDNMITAYSTPLLSSSAERITNIQIVCDRLNNFILNPNETFSYNDVTGPFGPDDGFKEATILLSDGSKSEGYGGGVCQLSSTLYNVIKNIENIEIIERHNHSAPVAYVPEGEDATVSLQSGLDFKFINNNNYPIRFEAECESGKVKVWAYKEI